MGRSPMRAEDRERTRGRILDAAETVFARDGFERARIDSIGAEAGLSTGTLYNYFHNKTSLVLELHQRALDRANAMVEALGRGDGPFPAKLDVYLEGFFRFGSENWMFLTLLRESPHQLRLSPRLAEEQVRSMRRLVERHVDLAEGLLRLGIEEGFLQRADPRQMAVSLLGMANGVSMLWADRPERAIGDAVAFVRASFLDGARRRPDPPQA